MEQKNNNVSITMIFQAGGLNYGEGIGNISELKKINRADGNMYTFASRQALRYDIVRLGHECFGWNLQTVDKAQKTIQFQEKYSIADSEEMDLFGYMKTKSKKDKTKKEETEEDENSGADIRSAVVRISNAISLEVYRGDMDFLTNKGLADRIAEFPNIANIEMHESFYTYTVTIDLAKVGIDGDIELSPEIKAKRVCQLLEILKTLNRNIRGREENLSPVFAIGGNYAMYSPVFLGRIKLQKKRGGFTIDTRPLLSTLELSSAGISNAETTKVAIIDGIFDNTEEIKQEFKNQYVSMEEFFNHLEETVRNYYLK